jgi:hypothetical protein
MKLGIWSPEDAYQEILLQIATQDWPRERTFSRNLGRWLDVDPARVITFIKSRLMDARRRERYRRPASDVSPRTPASRVPVEEDPHAIISRLIPSAPRDVVALLVMLAFPPEDAQRRAHRDQQRKIASAGKNRLIMNVRGAPKITRRHVALACGVEEKEIARAVRVAASALAV